MSHPLSQCRRFSAALRTAGTPKDHAAHPPYGLGSSHCKARSIRVQQRASDYDADHNIDLADLAGFPACLSGPGALPSPSAAACVDTCLTVFDLYLDLDVDLGDFG